MSGRSAIEGTVDQVLPKLMFQIRLDDGRDIRAGLSTQAKHAVVRVLAGDRVEVAISTHDPKRGRITKKLSP